ncbi:hypothetical protein GQX74_011978 [Glossina fuscipes]|nr:hypothetical protein GQX74_011978 [Glossina fuscipes]
MLPSFKLHSSFAVRKMKHASKKSKHRQSLYSIEFGPSLDTIRSRADTILDYGDDHLHERCIGGVGLGVSGGGCGEADGSELSPKPMTPRRVKRRSVMARGSNSRQSTSSRRSHISGSASGGTSIPSSLGSGGIGSLSKTNNNHYQSFRKNIPPDPIYYNTNAQTGLFEQAWQTAASQSPPAATLVDEPQSPTLPLAPSLGGGHYNPTYQHSTTNLNDGEQADELYNNRPPSVRSSYSNFHGTRPITSYTNSTGATENVFAGLMGANAANTTTAATTTTMTATETQQFCFQQTTEHVPPSTPPLYQQHPLHNHSISEQNLPPPPPLPAEPQYVSSPPQPIPFAKRTASRESIRSMAFLSSGPPAYNLNYHTPPDSETTM